MTGGREADDGGDLSGARVNAGIPVREDAREIMSAGRACQPLFPLMMSAPDKNIGLSRVCNKWSAPSWPNTTPTCPVSTHAV